MSTQSTLLVFPAGIDGAKEYMQIAQQLSIRIIAASSVPFNAGELEPEQVVHLPFISDKEFQNSLKDVCSQHNITHIYTPHNGVWWQLKKLQEELKTPEFVLCGTNPFVENWNKLKPYMEWAQEAQNDKLSEHISTGNPSPPLNQLQYTALSRGYIRIPGESDLEKLSALCSVARHLPQGDVIEIGTLYGRSAYALARLSEHYNIGSTICIDPWRSSKLDDQGPTANDLCKDEKLVNLDQVFNNFLSTAIDISSLSYIRETSKDAIHTYKSSIESGYHCAPNIKPIPITGKIALLHIDGNHRYDHVLHDVETWAPYLMPGGWLLLDDYIWAFGDGPKRVGDHLIKQKEYDCAFVASDTLFLRKV